MPSSLHSLDAVARARALIGRRFGLHGRGEVLDCVGLVAAAHGVTGLPTGYALRTNDAGVVERELVARGFVQGDAIEVGDVLVLRPGPAQLHLGLWTGDALIHADAGLRRVVERPGPPPWPVLSTWRKEN